MPAYLITYDLNKETKRPPIVDKIKSIAGDNWAKLSESSYVIRHSGTPDDVYNAIKSLIDSNDRIYIIPLKKPWQGFGLVEVNTWLNNNLPD